VSRRATWTAAAAAAVLLAISFYALVAWLEQGQLSDVPGYARDAGLVRGGAVPYRDFRFEYPPAALPVLLLPAYLGWSYATSFAMLMGVCGAGCIAAAASALRAVGAGAVRTWAGLLAIGVSPLVLGSLFDTRFDLWPTLLAICAVAAIVRERPVVSGLLLGLGFAAKLWPGVLLPIAVAYLWRRRGRRGAFASIGAFIAVGTACFLPFVALAPRGLADSLKLQLDRPLQVESLGSAVLMALRHAGVLGRITTFNAPTGQVLRGAGTGVAADLSTVLEVAAVAAVWIVFARRRDASREDVFATAAACVAVLIAFDKVLSPQYLIWLVPLVAVVLGTRGFVAAALLLLALFLTQLWFPQDYFRLAEQHESPWSWYLLARDLTLVALGAVLLAGFTRARDSGERRAGWRAARRAAA
jgi:Glycosyltransferase family 87